MIFEGEKRFDVVIRLAKEFRQDINSPKNLYIDLSNGAQVPLKEVADISYKPGPMQISRDNTYRRISVGVNVRGRDVKSMVEEILQKLESKVKLPPGYYVTYGGSFENLQRASDRLMIVVPIALFLIFILLYFALSSFSQSVMIYMAVPLAAIGGVFALWVRGMPFSISAGVGFIVLFGVAVLNGLVLINKFNELKENGMTNLKDRIYAATHERLRPILLTATAAIMGFIPMAVSTSGGAEVQRPLATVVLGGLITATFLTLVVIPILYYWLESRKKKNKTDGSVSYSSKPMKIVTVILMFGGLMVSENTFAQNANQDETIAKTLTIDEAIAVAKQNYPSLKESKAFIERVISCPCALVISIPLGYFGGLGAASKNGILFKGASFLDEMTKITTVVMDKTGTVTKGVFKIKEIVISAPLNDRLKDNKEAGTLSGVGREAEMPVSSEVEMMKYLMAMEAQSTHPIATAIMEYKAEGDDFMATDVTEIAGKGLKGTVNGKTVLVGNKALLTSNKIEVPAEMDNIVESIVMVAIENKFAGYVIIADELKDDAHEAIKQIREAGITKIIMLSGDKDSITQQVAKEMRVDWAKGGLLPEDKLAEVEKLMSETNNKVAFIGDGINDAPVLAVSDLGIAMGG